LVAPEVLSGIELFSRLPRPQVEKLARVAVVKDFEAGEIIVTESEPRRGFHVVLEGRVKVFKASPDGKEQTVFVFGGGEPFCLCGAFGDEGHLASAAALAPSRVLALQPAGVETLAREEPTLLMAMVSLLSRRLKESLELIESLSLRGLPARLAAFLLQAAEEAGGERVVRLHLTHRELAKMLNATPEALSRTLKRLSDEGLVASRGREIAVLDEAGLRETSRG
jgi:CRP/FNR family transcriptional regulator